MISPDKETGLYTVKVNEEQLHAIQVGLAEQFMWFTRACIEYEIDAPVDEEHYLKAQFMRKLFKESLMLVAHREDVIEFANDVDSDTEKYRKEKIIDLEKKRKEKNDQHSN